MAEKSRPLEEKKVRKKVPPEPSPPPKSPLEAYLHTELEAGKDTIAVFFLLIFTLKPDLLDKTISYNRAV